MTKPPALPVALIADYPDPQFSDGGAQISIMGGRKGSDINPQNPQFQAAQKACQGLLPFKGARLSK